MKVLVVMPRNSKLFKAMEEASNINIAEFILVGNKNYIIEKCYKENISTSNFTIYNIIDDIEITSFCIEMKNNNKIDFIIFDETPSYYQSKILGVKEEDIGIIDIIDMPFLKSYIFISNCTKRLNVDFDDKRKAIIQADAFMKLLEIKKTNVSFISSMNNKTDLLEYNIIKMILKDSNFLNINVYDPFPIEILFSKSNSINIYNSGINLFIMRNYESSRIFIDTLNIFTNTKIASFLVTKNQYAIDCNQMKDYHNILFSIMLLNRIDKNMKINCYKKEHVI